MLLKDIPELLVYEVTNESFEVVGIIDAILISWTKYFNKFADISLKVLATEQNIKLLTKNRIIYPKGGTDAAFIDIVEIQKTEKGELILQIKGRTLESLLDRRVFYGRVNYENLFVSSILALLVRTTFITSPISNQALKFFKISDDYEDVAPQLENCQYSFGSIYDHIHTLCETYPNLGYEMQFNPEEKRIIFQILQSNDHTENSENPVVFSSALNNILSSEYYSSVRDFKNVAFVAGEGTGSSRVTVLTGDVNCKGYDRFEYYVDARDLQKEGSLTSEQYRKLLTNRGLEKLSGLKKVDTISAKIFLPNSQYAYGTDYKVGDMVTIEDKDIGVKLDAQVTGLRESISDKYEAELIIGYEQATLAGKLKTLYG